MAKLYIKSSTPRLPILALRLLIKSLTPPLTVAFLALASSLVQATSPVAVDDTRTVPANTSLTINVIGNDFDADGDELVVTGVLQPEHGSATINTDSSIRYVPDEGFQGTDTFSYFIEDVARQPAVSSASVTISVTSPSSLLDEETNSAEVADTLGQACSNLQDIPGSSLSAGQQDLLDNCLELAEIEIETPELLEEVTRQIAPEETTTQLRTSTNSSRSQTNAVKQRINLVRDNAGALSFNGKSWSKTLAGNSSITGGSAGDEPSPWSRLGIFASAQQENSEQDQTKLESGYEYTGNTLTLGSDYLLTNQLIVGGALGWTQSDTDYSGGNGGLTTDIYTFIAYGTYFTGNFSFDLQVGYGAMDFESNRNIHYTTTETVDLTASGFTSGEQWLINGGMDWQVNHNAFSFNPFVRFDYVISNIDAYGENGADGLNMELGEQAIDQLMLSTGFQTTYVFSQSWGVLIPLANFRVLSEVNSEADPVIGRFAFDPDPDNTFTLTTDEADNLYYQWGVGASAVFKGGLSIFAEYQELIGRDNLTSNQIQAGFRYEL